MGAMLHPTVFVGPRDRIKDADSTGWWTRNTVPKQLVKKPRVDREIRRKIDNLLKRQAEGALVDDVKQVALKVYEAVGTPIALGLKRALLAGDAGYIAGLRIDPRTYKCASEYFMDACAVNFLRKYEDLGLLCGKTTVDTRTPALNKFFQAERQCEETNARIIAYQEGLFSPTLERLEEYLEFARQVIKEALGPAPTVNSLELRFGPGATSACSGDSVTIADKLAALPELTWDSRWFVTTVQSSPVWLSLIAAAHPESVHNLRFVTDDYGDLVRVGGVIAPRLVRGNRFTTVPKSAEEDRGICIEPHTLSALQLAVASYLNDALTRLGIRKDIQQVVNKGFALAASLFEGFATVDLKSASDTVAYELVKLLLPWDWFVLLASLRSSETCVDGQWVELEKFSSMGNGFTFELETLIFYALARAVSDITLGKNTSPVCTYGDDIIVANGCYTELINLLDWCGFTTNESKSFSNGSFRESCGGDYFGGHDVRPYYLKETPRDPSDWFGIANGLARNNERCSALELGPTRFGPAWLRCINNVPKSARLYGPKGFGDDWIAVEDHSRWTTKTVDGLLYVMGRRRVPRHRLLERYCDDTRYAVLLYGGGTERLSLRGEPERVTVEWYAVGI